METLKEFLGNDLTNIYRFESYGQFPADSWEIDRAEPGKIYYMPSQLSFGDYDSSGAVERANVKVFLERFKGNKFIKHHRGPYSSESICIDILCDDPEILEVLAALADYPAMNDEAVSEVERELEEEAMPDILKWDFRPELKKRFEFSFEDAEEETLYTWLRELMEKTNTYGKVAAGGNYYLDVERIVARIEELPTWAVELKTAQEAE